MFVIIFLCTSAVREVASYDVCNDKAELLWLLNLEFISCAKNSSRKILFYTSAVTYEFMLLGGVCVDGLKYSGVAGQIPF